MSTSRNQPARRSTARTRRLGRKIRPGFIRVPRRNPRVALPPRTRPARCPQRQPTAVFVRSRSMSPGLESRQVGKRNSWHWYGESTTGAGRVRTRLRPAVLRGCVFPSRTSHHKRNDLREAPDQHPFSSTILHCCPRGATAWSRQAFRTARPGLPMD